MVETNSNLIKELEASGAFERSPEKRSPLIEGPEISPVVLTNKGLDAFIDYYGKGSVNRDTNQFETTDKKLARQISNELQNQYPEFISYQGLKDGTAPFLDTVPRTSYRRPEQRKLTDDQIISLFARDSEGDKIVGAEGNTLLEGIKRRIVSSAGGLYAGTKLAGAAFRGAPGNPFVKTVAAGGGFLTGLLGMDFLGQRITDAFLGEEPVRTPSQRARYEAGKTIADMGVYAPAQMYLPSKARPETAALIDDIFTNATRLKEKFIKNKSLSPEEWAQTGVRKLIEGKYTLTSPFKRKFGNPIPATLRFANAVENMLVGGGQIARKNPIAVPLVESIATLSAAKGAEMSETAYPGQMGPRLASEIAFSIAPTLMGTRLIRYGSKIKEVLSGTNFKEAFNPADQNVEGGVKGLWKEAKESLSPFKRKRQIKFKNALFDKFAESPDYQLPDGTVDQTKINALADLLEKKRFDVDGKEIIESAAARTGDPVMMAMESAAALSSLKLQNIRSNQQVKEYDLYVETIYELSKSGDPQLMKIASEMAYDAHVNNNTMRITELTDNILAAADKVVGPEEFTSVVSSKLYESLDNLMTITRNKERKLWKLVENVEITQFKKPNGEIVSQPNFITVWEDSIPTTPEAANESLRQLNDLGQFVQRKKMELGLEGADDAAPTVNSVFGDEEDVLSGTFSALENSVTLQELVDMRSTALNLMRKLAPTDKNSARIAGVFAEALLDDINSLETGGNAAYDMARAYSKARNDVFTRTYQGPLNAMTRLGGSKIPPELMSTTLQRGGAGPTLVRIKEALDVSDFAQKNNLEGFGEVEVADYNSILNAVVRNARASSFDPETGAVNPKNLQKWMRDNKEMLDLPVFFGLRNDLENAATANTLLKTTVERQAAETKNLKKAKSFLNFLPVNKTPDGVTSVESPALVIGQAIESMAPMSNLNNILDFIVNPVKGGAPRGSKYEVAEGLKGFKAGIFEYAYLGADANSTGFSPLKFYKTIFETMPKTGIKRGDFLSSKMSGEGAGPAFMTGGVSLADFMLKNKMITKKELNTVKDMVVKLSKYEAMDAAGKLTDDILGETASPAMDLYIKIAGSKLGASVAGFAGAGADSLIVRSAGVRYLQTILQDIPNSMNAALMGEFFENPELMAALLRKGKTPVEETNIIGSIRKILVNAGLLAIKAPIKPGSISREVQEEFIQPEVDNLIENLKSNQENSVQTQPLPTPTEVSANLPRPGLNVNAGGPPVSNQQVAGSNSSVTPERLDQYKALFGQDSISQTFAAKGGLVRGIGSLV